ncbi:MAG: hypothetical protein AB7E55_03180 [Pigmentiphaga sp.]
MAYEHCLETIRAAAGRPLADDEIAELLEALQARERYFIAKGVVDNTRDAALRAADEIANDLEMAAIIEKRNAALNAVRRVERLGIIQNSFGHNFAEGLEALLVGVNRAVRGGRDSVMTSQEALTKSYQAGFSADMESAGLMKLFARGAMDREVSRALWAMGRDTEAQALAGLPKEAIDMARIINKWQEVARIDANKAGAWIRKRAGYIVRQSHDPARIKKSGFEEWMTDAARWFDFTEMGPMSRADLHELYKNLATGNHLKDAPPDVTGFKGPGNVAKRLSRGREIEFKDADAWFDYNTKYGAGNLREAFASGIQRAAHSTGMMRVLGTNPQNMFNAIRDDLLLHAKATNQLDQVDKIEGRRHALERYMAAVDGSMDIPGNALAARRYAAVRAVITMARLGGMLLSQLNDIAIYGSGVRYQGRGFFSGMGESVAGLGRSLKPQERRNLAASLGVVLDNMFGEIGRLGSFAEGGSVTRSVQTFMKWNLSTWWQNRMRTSAVFGMSHHMALNRGRAWAELDAEYRRVFDLYGITEKDWDVIRASSERLVDGREYLVPENVADEVVATKLRTYFTDQTSFLVLEPDAKTRSIMLQSTRPGTWSGEIARFLMQFKSFTGAYTQKILGRELYGRGYMGESGMRGIPQALAAGNGEFGGLVQLILASTVLGYGSMALKDMAKGRTPRDPLEDPYKVFMAAMLQGGGAGLYGDFLFGEVNRFGGGPVASAIGPAAGLADDVIQLYQTVVHGDKDGMGVASEALRIGLQNAPYVNLFYSRIALDYLLIYQLQDFLNPGYLRRMERRLERENNQTFLLRPSQHSSVFGIQ